MGSRCLKSELPVSADKVAGDGESDVLLAPCSGQSLEQRWLWTQDGQLLNAANFLCLAGVLATVKLQPCRLDVTAQQWRCAGRHITQPSTGSCVTAGVTESLPVSPFEEALDRAAVGAGNLPLATLQPCNAKRDDQKWEAQFNTSERSHVCARSPEHNSTPCEIQRMRSQAAMGWITCNSLGYYVKGLQRSSVGNKEALFGIQCCSTSHVFTGRADGPATVISEECELLNTRGNERSFVCPRGMFLKGLYFLGANSGTNVVKCCRPETSSQRRYLHCFTGSLDRQSVDEPLTCANPGYSITAMSATKCNDYRCASALTCCY